MSLPSYAVLAKKAYNKGQWSLAFSYAQWAISANPQDFSSLRIVAALYLKKDQAKAALDTLSKAPLDKAFISLRAEALTQLKREDEALALLKQFPQKKTDQKQAIERRLFLKEVLKNFSGPLERALNLFDQCVEHELYEEAKTLLKPFSKNSSLNPAGMDRLYYRLGVLHFKKQDYTQALKAFEKAKILKPQAVAIDYYLALIHYQKNALDNSLYFFQKVLKKDPNYYSLPLNLAKLYLSKGQLLKAGYRDSFRQLQGSDFDFVKDSKWYQREKKPAFSPPNLASLAKSSLYIKGQEGLGDQCFYLRFVPELIKKGIDLRLYLDRRLIPLLPPEVASKSFAYHQQQGGKTAVLLNHLPLILKAFHYPPSLLLSPSKQALKEVQKLLKTFKGPFMGLQWRAGAFCKKDTRGVGLCKEVSLPSLAKAIETFPGTFVNLQYAPYPEEVDFLHRQFPGRVLDLYSLHHELDKLLALLFYLEEYLGVSNTCVHLREGLEKTSRVLIPRPWEWRWWGKHGKLFAFKHTIPYYQASLGDSRESWQKTWNALRSDLKGV